MTRCSPAICAAIAGVFLAAFWVSPITAAGDDFATAYRAGLAARGAGDIQVAIASFERASALRADHVDVLVQLATSYRIAHRLDEASAVFRRALILAPDSADTRLGIARIRIVRGDRPGAMLAVKQVLARDPANPEARILRRKLAQPAAAPNRRRWRIDAGYAYSSFTRVDHEPWREASTQIGYAIDRNSIVHARNEISRRFGKTDDYAQLGADLRINGWLSGYVHSGGTPSADFRPRWQVLAGATARIRQKGGVPGSTFLSIDSGWSRFLSGSVQMLTPGIRQLFFRERLSVTGNWINNFDERGSRSGGWRARLGWLADDRLRFFAGLSDAGETADNVTVDTRAYFGGVALDFGGRYGVRFDLVREDREASYIRNAVVISGFVRI